jgi:hypothetical protein
MPGYLDALLVGGAILGAGVYLTLYLVKKKGCQSCGSGEKHEKIQIRIPKR